MKYLLQFILVAIVSANLNAQPFIKWGQDIYGNATNDHLGYAVSSSADGNRIAIGAIISGNGNGNGQVTIYDWDGSIWGTVGASILGESIDDQFGHSVSLSADGNRVAIGAILNDEAGLRAGHVRLYDWDGNSWIQVGQDIDGTEPDDFAGYSVCLSADGSRVAIGAINYDENNPGKVRIYDWDGNFWAQVGQQLTDNVAGDMFGTCVNLSSDGNRLAIGIPRAANSLVTSGTTKVYDWDGNTWSQVGQDIDGEAAGDNSGHAVSLSLDGNRIAIGAHVNDGNGANSGHVRLYDWDGNSWTQVGQDIDGEAAQDRFGLHLGLSANGDRVAIGAQANDGNGSSAGHVRIYDWSGTMWEQVSQDIDGEDGDLAGNVCISDDGSRIVIGATGNDNNGMSSGRVRVYQNGGIMVSGKVYQDYDLDHELDTGEPLLDGQIMQLTADDGSTKYRTTTVNGEYYFAIEDSGTYVVSYNPPSNFLETGGITSVILQGLNDTLISDINFGVGYTDTIVDLETDLTLLSETQFGPSFQGWVSTSNVGNVTSGLGTLVSGSGTTTVSAFTQSNSTVQPGQITSDLISWSQTASVTTTVSVDVSAITGLGTDVNLTNNSDSAVVAIVIAPPSPPCCPYDPNDKTLFGATCEANYVVIGDTLEYRVRFMNTGTAPANTVILKDTLDLDYLDLLTFRPIGYSHEMNWDISGPGILTVTYPDIQLPDSSVSFLDSQGFFKYRIIMHDTVSNLTEIGSATYIYFDNEAPIQTNTPSIIAVDSIPLLSLSASNAICDGSLGYVTGSVSFDIGIVEADWMNGSTDYPLGYNTEEMFSGFLTDAYGCVYEDSIQTVCDLVSSISDGESNQLSVYPNPTSGLFEITGIGELSIHNALGELVLTENISGNATIDLSTQANGIYTLQLQTEKETFTSKLIKQ